MGRREVGKGGVAVVYRVIEILSRWTISPRYRIARHARSPYGSAHSGYRTLNKTCVDQRVFI